MEKIPKQYNPEEEKKIYAFWQESGFFNPDICLKKGLIKKTAPAYSIMMPPPNRTGTLHMGHALTLVIEDILTRYHRMKGERTLWVPGSDHAAIATQNKVEKLLLEEGLTRHKLGRENFLKRVVAFADQSHATIKEQIKKMGASCDWSREAYTFDETRNKVVNLVFKLMYEDGLIYRGNRIVNWCPRCHSTLADDEIEYRPQRAKFYTFRYSPDFPFLISTTRPETKLGDTAVAVNPKDPRYKKYLGRIFKVNFVGLPLKIKVIADRAVAMDFGTGALGVTPAHSALDWKMAKENDLEIIKVIDEDGKIHPGFGKYSRQEVHLAREMILTELKKNKLLEKEEELENNLSLCYRCETPIEPLPSLQWFIDVNKKIPKLKKSLKELSLEAVKKGIFDRKRIKIIPPRFEKNYFHWMNNLQDWCISRQIWFGHQIPVWYRKGEIFVGTEMPPGNGWKRDEDTLDTWFSSGLWTFSTLIRNPAQVGLKKGRLEIKSEDFQIFHPTSVLETGYDILFFWVARMILMTTYTTRDLPFKDVYLHGLIRDEQGRKMSKSLGNSIDPLDSCKKFGTDTTRLSLVMGSTPGNDLNLSEEKIISYRNFVTKLWNISRFVITQSASKKQKNLSGLSLADQWILSKINVLIKEVSQDLENYKFSLVGEKLKDFTWNDFADWYLEISKLKPNAAVLNYVLERILSLWHPFIPFVTEKIYAYLKKEPQDFLIVKKWPTVDKKFLNIQSEKKFNQLQEIISKLRVVRSNYHINPAKTLVAYSLRTAEAEIIEKLARVKIETEKPKKGKRLYEIAAPGFLLKIDLAEIIDLEKELLCLGKEIRNYENLITQGQALLKNPNFLKNAPPRIVEDNRQKLADYQGRLAIQKELRENLRKIA